MKQALHICLWAGLLPILSANGALLINMAGGYEGCFPYLEGCASVSRAVRSGQGLWLFKAAALPAAVLMWLSWRQVESLVFRIPNRRGRSIAMLGKASAVFFLVYAIWLGTDGEIYKWLRRYGVVFYFGFAGLAHLLLVSWVYRETGGWRGLRAAGHELQGYFLVVLLMWASGVGSAFKRKLIDNPAFLDRVENALEWNFALLLSLSFVVMGLMLRRMAPQPEAASQRSDSGQR